MEQILVMVQRAGVEYRESKDLVALDGFLMTFGEQRRITMNAQLSEEDRIQGTLHLLNYLAQTNDREAILYLWTCGVNDLATSSATFGNSTSGSLVTSSTIG